MNPKKSGHIRAIATHEPSEVLPVLYGIDQNFRFSDYILEYLANKGIVGKSFYDLCLEKKFLPISVGNYVLKKMEHDKYRPLTFRDLQ
jgi:hypothetical protein